MVLGWRKIWERCHRVLIAQGEWYW